MKNFTKYLLLAILLLSFSFNSFAGKPQHEVKNSPWDGSVYQVTRYLKNTLNDPKSYESISWGEVKHTPQGYLVGHKYRAKNAFGGYVVKFQIFHLDFGGRVTGVEP